MTTAFPIATSAHDALNLLKAGTAARAAREREAEALGGGHVSFVTESVGPLYDSEADAVAACGGLIGEDRACRLVCRMKEASRPRCKPVEAVFRDGERWPKMNAPPAPVWQMSVSYWKVLATPAKRPAAAVDKPASALRRKGGDKLTPEELQGLMESPMTAARPQKALDFGLFDFPLPENPGIIIADE